MADRIIKPDSGNQLVLQDEGGSAALTIDTSGNTILAGSLSATFPAGHILQTVQETDQSERSTTSNTFGTNSSTCSPSITMTSASNKVLVIFSSSGDKEVGGSYTAFYTIFRGASNLGHSTAGIFNYSEHTNKIPFALQLLDAPGAGTHTYTIQFRTDDGSGRWAKLGVTMYTVMTLMEVVV